MAKRDKLVSMSLVELIEDFSIYPRVSVDDSHVSRLVKALMAGATLPPPIVDSKSKRIADGFHRKQAHLRVQGTGGVTDVLLRDYVSEDELLQDAISMNTTHGKSLDEQDYARCAKMLENRGIDEQRIAVIIHRSEPEVRKLLFRVARAEPGSPNIVPGTISTVILKRPVLHLADKVLTKEQADALPTVPGTNYHLLVRQLLDALRVDFINREDEKLQQALRELRDALIAYCE